MHYAADLRTPIALSPRIVDRRCNKSIRTRRPPRSCSRRMVPDSQTARPTWMVRIRGELAHKEGQSSRLSCSRYTRGTLVAGRNATRHCNETQANLTQSSTPCATGGRRPCSVHGRHTAAHMPLQQVLHKRPTPFVRQTLLFSRPLLRG